MVNSVTLTKRLTNEGWSVTGKIEETSTVPHDILVYLNTGTSVLGEYHSVVTIVDMPRIPIWKGIAIPTPLAKYVRTSTVKILVDGEVEVDSIISGLNASLTKFVKEFNSERESTKTYVID